MSVAASPLVSTTTRSADAVTREVIIGKLLATVDEMAIVLARASMSPVIYEVLDFACGICDGRGDLVAQTNGITVFTGTFSRQVHFIIERFASDIAPGDTFLTNDPFEGGTHACDFAVIRPIFAEGKIVAYAIADRPSSRCRRCRCRQSSAQRDFGFSGRAAALRRAAHARGSHSSTI